MFRWGGGGLEEGTTDSISFSRHRRKLALVRFLIDDTVIAPRIGKHRGTQHDVFDAERHRTMRRTGAVARLTGSEGEESGRTFLTTLLIGPQSRPHHFAIAVSGVTQQPELRGTEVP